MWSSPCSRCLLPCSARKKGQISLPVSAAVPVHLSQFVTNLVVGVKSPLSSLVVMDASSLLFLFPVRLFGSPTTGPGLGLTSRPSNLVTPGRHPAGAGAASTTWLHAVSVSPSTWRRLRHGRLMCRSLRPSPSRPRPSPSSPRAWRLSPTSLCRSSGVAAPSGEMRKDIWGQEEGVGWGLPSASGVSVGKRGGTGMAWCFVRLGDELREAGLTPRLAYH
jgi:hypothetical protein